LKQLGPPVRAAFIRNRGARATVGRARNPLPNGSFGYVGRFVRLNVLEGGDELDGTLVIGVDDRRLGPVAPESLRVFRWDEEQRGFELVEGSKPGQMGGYVWAPVTQPGLYALIGLNADPLVSRTLAVLATLEDWLGLPIDGGRATLGSRICELILCAPDLRDGLSDEVAVGLVESNAGLGLPVSWGDPWPSGGGGDPCAACLGIGFELTWPPGRGLGIKRPPELQLEHFCVNPFFLGGRWALAPVIPQPPDVVLAVHAALLRTGNVLFFGGSENVESQHNTGGAALDHTRLWDATTGAITKLPSPAQDVFCCGHALLADGRLLVAGGTQTWGGGNHPVHWGHFGGLRDASIFDPGAPAGTNPWSTTGSLNPERGQATGGGSWYPTLITLPDGRVLRAGGHPQLDDTRHMNRMIEIFDPATGVWIDQGAGADMPQPGGEAPLYPRLFVLPDGKIFMANTIDGPSGGPAWHCWMYDPVGKAWSDVCPAAQPAYFDYDTTAVLLPLLPSEGYRPRILYAGHEPANIIDLGDASPSWRATSARPLIDPATGQPTYRYHATAVLLPDASVLVVGGHSDPTNWQPPVLTPERYDPLTGTWSTLAAASVPRVYHSVALLLPDGRVWTAGSDYGAAGHEGRIELFSPPYLYRGPRPTVASLSSRTVTPGGSTFEVGTAQANSIASVALLRCGSATHAYVPDQRYVGLVVASRTGTKLAVEPPPNHNIAPPGYYLLFVVDTNGVPSVGEFVRIA